MAQAINVPVNVQAQNTRQLTQQIQASLNSVRLNLGNGRALSSLSQPLGRLTGQADEFTKSLDAANARVLAFGASVGIVNAFSNAFKNLVASTIEVEKAIKAITVVGDQFNGKTKELTQGLFNVAKTTGQSFAEVSKAALEFSRQGKGIEETLQRTQDALILTRLTGLDAAKAVEGLTAAANGFSKAGLSTTQILNKLAAVDQAFAVSSADLIEGFNRSAAVAQNAGVTFDELTGIITALQQETSRGGAVIGNALKTIFTRLQDTSTLNKLQGLGIAVKDLQNNILPARQILQNLANDVEGLGEITKAGIFKDVAGTFQINQLISLVSDLNNENSVAANATKKAAGATNEAFVANEKLNQSLDAIINKVALTGKQLGSLIGELGLSDSFKGILDGINSFLEGATNLLQGDDLGSKFAKGIVKGIGAVLTGPGLGIFLAVIGKLTLDLVKFGTQSIKTFFGIGQAAKQQQQVQESIVQTLLRNENVLRSILNTQGGQNAQAQTFLTILNQQEQALQNIRSLAGGIAAPIIAGGYGVGPQGGIQRRGRAAGGYLPAQEAADVRRGVGGASPSSKVVAIPNFAFGGGKRGTMIANTSEYIVPNYAGGGSAIFNQDMVKTMGLPPGAKKIGAAGGFVPNFAIRGLASNESVLAGRVFEALIRRDKYVDLTENKVRPDIPKGERYGEAEAKMSIEAALRDKNFGPGKRKGNVVIVPKDSSRAYDQELKEQKGSNIIRPTEDELSRANIFPIARKILKRESLQKQSPYSRIPLNASGGYIPNFAFTNDQLGVLGLYGPNTPINGSQVYTFESNRPEFYKDIKSGYEKRVTGFVNSYAKQIAKKIGGGFQVSPKAVIKSLDQSRTISGFIFEDVMNQLAGPNFDTNRVSGNVRIDFPMTSNLREVFGVTGVERFAEVKLTPQEQVSSIIEKQEALARALATGGYAPKETDPKLIEELRKEAIEIEFGKGGRPKRTLTDKKKAFIQKMRSSGLLTQTYLGQGADEANAIKKALGLASTGYIPNFAASALQQAIAREKSAGLSSSQIYVDQSSALKSPSNPMGLMVANTRDEPAGGFQGIARARKEGANPKLYGAANGFVPNYAVQAPIGEVSAIKGILAQDKVDAFNKALEGIAKQLKSNQISLSQAEQDIENFAKAVGTSKKGQDALISEGKKLIQAYDSESKARKQKAEELRKQRSERQVSSTSPQSPKGVGDSLAKVVGLQSAVLGLQTVIEAMADEGSDFAKASQTIGGVIAAIGSGATLFTAGLGPLGIALGAVVVGFNLLKDVFPTTLQSIKESFGGLSLEGQKASKALDEFAEKISRGGVSVEEAFKTAEQQAAEASLRAKAKGAGVKTETETGAQKDPVKLARELVIENTRRNQSLMGIGLGTNIYKEVGSELTPSLGTNFGEPQQKVRYSIFGQAEALFSDFNTSTQNVIFDILEESVSVNKTGLVALGKKIQKQNPKFAAKDFKDLSSDKDILDYRAKLLSAIVGGEDVKKILQKAIQSPGVIGEGGKFDQNKFQQALKESNLANIPVELLKDLGKAAQDVENATPTSVFRKNLDDLILQYNNFSTQINRGVTSATNLLEGLTGSSTFSALSEQRQFQLKSGLDRFKSNTSFAKSQRDLTEQVRTFVNNQAKNIENISGKPELEERLRSFVESGTIDDLEETLTYLSENSSLSGDKLFELQKETSNLINANRDLNSNREVENALLEFSIQERQNELSAMKTFYDGIESFTKGIRGQEARLRQIDFELKKVQQDTSFQKELLNIQAPTLDAFRSGTVDIENTALNKETNLRLEQAKIQADIELKRNLYTLENITALNRNTEALEANLKPFQEQSLNDKISRLEKDIGYTRLQGGSDADISELQAQLNIAKSSLQALSSATLPTSDMGLKMRELINASSEDARRAILDSIPNQAQRENLRKLYRENAASLEAQIDNINKDVEIQKGNVKNQQKINSALDSYESALNTTARGLKQSLLSDPKSLGQFASGQRALRIAQEEQRRRQTGGDAAVREYRSSFGRGFEEALGPIEEKTLDFKNELGREIPQLFSQNLAQGLNDAISGAKSLKDALRDAATSFLNAITQKNIQNLADLFTGGVGSFFTRKASGGMINGGSGTKDDVPAMLMGGEYVIKKSAVKKYGSKFLDSLNNGGIKAFAKGGGVQSGRGGFYVPGDYGEGAITGKNQLLAFAGQSFTGGQYDQVGVSGMSGASINLESESARLTAFGRENSPMFERVQQAKEEAFNVYLNQLKQEQQYREQLKQIEEAEKARQKQLITAIVSAVATSALSYAGTAFGTGAENAVAEAGAQAGKPLTFMQKLTTGFMGGLRNLGAAILPGGAKPTFELSNSAKADRFMNSVGFNNSFKPDYSGGTFNTGSYLYNPSQKGFGRVGKASGGMIIGGSGVRDDVPAMLTGGEFVLNNRATRKLGIENLNRLNSGDVGGNSGASGQQVSESIISKLDELIQTTRESSKENVVVNVSGMEASEKRADENKSANDRELQRKIRDAVLAVLAQEKRMGGSLNK